MILILKRKKIKKVRARMAMKHKHTHNHPGGKVENKLLNNMKTRGEEPELLGRITVILTL